MREKTEKQIMWMGREVTSIQTEDCAELHPFVSLNPQSYSSA
jgi:hypothetical protein